ncbi:MAG: isopeptide-forming domain-containing fimbrial protein [Herpetosiphonaceae bacterium]|nr:isopeptide-forming domain-containing fimbrial protein [Herpetosiphonaceae bacterium]
MTVNVRLTQRWFSLVAIIMLLTTFFSSATSMQAQTPTPAPMEASPTFSAEPGFDTAIAEPANNPTHGQPFNEAEAGKPNVTVETAPDSGTDSATPELNLGSQAIQGTVALSISVQPVVRHSEYITYSFNYKNNGTTATTSLILDVLWSDLRYEEDGGALQYCPPSTTDVPGCGFIKASVFGPTITVGQNIPSGIRYNIASLAPGQSGGFKVHLIIHPNNFPRSLPGGAGVKRPTASGKVYVNGEVAPSTELTVTSLVVGPPLRITKTATPDTVLYPLETAPFTITVGNATGSGDIINGQMRADARPATNVVVQDTFPLGSQLISAEGNPTVSGNLLTWVIPVLNPGDSRQYKVVFRKLDGQDCGILSNWNFNVTSNELPVFNGIRIRIPGDGAAYPVRTPLIVKEIWTNPGGFVYGTEAVVTIVVQSFWSQPLTGVNLQFKLPDNTTYLAGTSNPAVVTEPPPGQFGSTVNWVFNMPAGTRTVPAEKTFLLRVRAGFFDLTTPDQLGMATVTPPAGVPNACSIPMPFNPSLLARLIISMGSNAPVDTKYSDNSYYVQRGQNFPYVLNLVNNSNQALVVDKVWVTLPNDLGANFTYVPNSSRVNGVLQAPNTIQNGLAGKLEWLNIPVAANSQTVILFSLTVQGNDYFTYCTTVYGTLAAEKIDYGLNPICVKINPQMKLVKTVNKTKAVPGEEVIFTISLKNLESAPYQFGLLDHLLDFDWIGQVSGYATPSYDPSNRVISWPVVTIQPGETISASFRARVPGDINNCNPGDKLNRLLFQNMVGPITPIPPVFATVQVSCALIRFVHSVERTLVSLEDRFTYQLAVINMNSTGPSTTVAITDVLPVGFTYAGMDPTSPIATPPTQTVDSNGSGRVQLNWSVPPIEAGGTAIIKFFARSGKSIGLYENWFIASTVGGISNCIGDCAVKTYKNTANTYNLTLVSVQALITIEPSISPTTCVLPNTNVNYRLTVLNTNSHSYLRTTVVLTLPLGLSYVSPVGTTAIPQTSTHTDGTTALVWTNITVPAKPDNAFGAQVIFEVTLKVGNIWGNVNTELAAISTSGLIPRKDGTVDSTVKICPQQPSLAKTIVQHIPKIGDQVIYQISVANPNNTAVTATVQDILPANLSFVGMLAGNAPAQSGNTLTWNLTLPAATSPSGSVVILKFKARINSGVVFQKYTNTATVTQSSVPFTTSINGVPINTATFTLGKPSYHPQLRR